MLTIVLIKKTDKSLNCVGQRIVSVVFVIIIVIVITIIIVIIIAL